MSLNDKNLRKPASPPIAMTNTNGVEESDATLTENVHDDLPQRRPPSIEYLEELLKDKKSLELVGAKLFLHVESLLDAEITRVRHRLLFTTNRFLESQQRSDLPEPSGSKVLLCDKVYVPVETNPQCNFIGRLLGPRGITAKELEHNLGCKLMIRGRGSMKEKVREEQLRGQPNFEHLDDDLHVLVQVEDAENRAQLKLKRAKDAIERFLVATAQTPDGNDELKRYQLIQLAILNGSNCNKCNSASTHAHGCCCKRKLSKLPEEAPNQKSPACATSNLPMEIGTATALNSAATSCILSALPLLQTYTPTFPTLLNAPVSLGGLQPIPIAQFSNAPMQTVSTPPTPPCSIGSLQVNSSPSNNVSFQQPVAFPQPGNLKFTYSAIPTATQQMTGAMQTTQNDVSLHQLHQHQNNANVHAANAIRSVHAHGNLSSVTASANAAAYQQAHQTPTAFYPVSNFDFTAMQPCSVYR